MRVIPVGAPLSSGSSPGVPRFRIVVHEGAESAPRAFDVLDAAVEEALGIARELSRDDELLWALALVGEHGLVWISGTDYPAAPATPRDRRGRRQMQDRFLSARVRRGKPPLLPDGRRVIRLFPEWAPGWPLWESFTPSYRLTGDDLGLSPGLSVELRAWNDRWAAREVDDPEPEGWRAEGHRLHARLEDELADVAEVRAEFDTEG